MQIKPIGIVHSPITTTAAMSHRGSPATVEVFPQFQDGLLGIEDNSHIVIVSWMHQANRHALQVDRVGPENLPLHKGVFALRSPSRPNPLGITTAKLLKVEGRNLLLDRLDLIDGTPVVDIKAYSIGLDTIFSAQSFWDKLPATQRDPKVMIDLIRSQAVSFHGRTCCDLLLGVAMVYDVCTRWGIAPREPRLKFELAMNGCIVDAIQGATGATFGNGRLSLSHDYGYIATLDDKALRYVPRDFAVEDGHELLQLPISTIFDITEVNVPSAFSKIVSAGDCQSRKLQDDLPT